MGTVTLTVKDLRRILTHGQQFPFFTAKEREEGGVGHWETRAWETCDVEVWGTTRDLGFPVTKYRDIVKYDRGQADQLYYIPGDFTFQQTGTGGSGPGGGAHRVHQDSEGGQSVSPERRHHGPHLLRRRDGHWGTKLSDTTGMVSDAKCVGDELDWGR